MSFDIDYSGDSREESSENEKAQETAYDILKEADEAEFYSLPNEKGNLLWSVLSLLAALGSAVLFAFTYVGGLIAAAVAIALSVVSSRKLGFFDRMALFGLIFGIFGMVFGAFSMALDLFGVLELLAK